MASPKTIAFNKAIAERQAVTQERLVAEYAESHPSLPRTSTRWMGRSKGLPFSHHKLLRTIHRHGDAALLVLKHPTKGTVKVKRVTNELLSTFFPSLPPELASQLLFGR